VRENGVIWLDDARRYQVFVNAASEPTGISWNGAAQTFGRVEEDSCEQVPAGVAVAPSSMSLRAIIQLRQRTGHPVLLVDAGCFCGICDEAQIVRALAGRVEDLHGATWHADAAN
jgi:glycine betaine/proline transport system ATP-binding protein